MKLVTVAQMRELERAAVAAGTPETQMMEEAGLAVAQEAWMLLGSLEGRRIVVLAGPGSNGGDGMIAARHLCDWGADVAVYLPRARKDVSLAHELSARDVPVVAGEDDPDLGKLESLLSVSDLVIDALLGIGKRRPLDPQEPIAVALQKLGEARAGHTPPKVIAVDLPTGVDADSGAVDALTVTPDLTVTFGLPKVGMYQEPASAIVGRVQVIDIGIPKAAQDAVDLELLTARWVRGVLPARPAGANKGTFGRVLVLGGSTRYPGAPRLAATAAYRAGAGLVTIATTDAVAGLITSALAEATWLPQVASDSGQIAAENVMALRSEWHAFRAAVIGPGMGLSDETGALLWAAMPDIAADVEAGVVFDADALNALATMADAAERMPANAILTPHPGEMARLLGTTVADVQSRRIEAAKEAAAKFGCVVVLKGAHSVIASPGGAVRLSPFANPLLATAGSGDILAGIIGGYLGQGLAPLEAASLAVYVHGATAEALREQYGDAGLLAGELADHLPRVVKDLRSG